jgi:coiled-coil domain-containing protein 39
VEQEKKKYVSLIDELTLENDMTYQDLNKIIKSKEDVLVQHDIMKLEIKKIRDRLSLATDQVFNLENEKYQLEMRSVRINYQKSVCLKKLFLI